MKIITYLFLTWGHKKGFCKPFHLRHDTPEHEKGYCRMLQVAWDLYNKPIQQAAPPIDEETRKRLMEKLNGSEERK